MKATSENCFHLTVEIVQGIHAKVIAKFGSAGGVRELALLESAVAVPPASFGGEAPYQGTERLRQRACLLLEEQSVHGREQAAGIGHVHRVLATR